MLDSDQTDHKMSPKNQAISDWTSPVKKSYRLGAMLDDASPPTYHRLDQILYIFRPISSNSLLLYHPRKPIKFSTLNSLMPRLPQDMAATHARRLALNPYGDQYPDDDSMKEVVLEADGLVALNPDDRHVLLRWTNAIADGNRYTQIIHLTGGPGNYNFYTPQVKIHSKQSLQANAIYELGEYTCPQRDQIIALARAVSFSRWSRVNSCRTWMRDLLEAMVGANLLSKTEFDKIDVDIPLKKRVAET